MDKYKVMIMIYHIVMKINLHLTMVHVTKVPHVLMVMNSTIRDVLLDVIYINVNYRQYVTMDYIIFRKEVIVRLLVLQSVLKTWQQLKVNAMNNALAPNNTLLMGNANINVLLDSIITKDLVCHYVHLDTICKRTHVSKFQIQVQKIQFAMMENNFHQRRVHV